MIPLLEEEYLNSVHEISGVLSWEYLVYGDLKYHLVLSLQRTFEWCTSNFKSHVVRVIFFLSAWMLVSPLFLEDFFSSLTQVSGFLSWGYFHVSYGKLDFQRVLSLKWIDIECHVDTLRVQTQEPALKTCTQYKKRSTRNTVHHQDRPWNILAHIL